jgi:hypothetical protein
MSTIRIERNIKGIRHRPFEIKGDKLRGLPTADEYMGPKSACMYGDDPPATRDMGNMMYMQVQQIFSVHDEYSCQKLIWKRANGHSAGAGRVSLFVT